MPRLPHHIIILALLSCCIGGVAIAQIMQAQTQQPDLKQNEQKQNQPEQTKSAQTGAQQVASVSAAQATATQQTPPALKSEFTPLELLSDNLWDRLGKNFVFATLDNPRIEKQIEFLSTGGSASLNNTLVNASPYLFHIADELERAEIPPDIILLPLVESAFNPTARSSQGAVGLWQFIAATASHYNLTVEERLDQRLDVIASTMAAVRYLNDLNLTFDGDWLLTLAAYNTGPGNVRKAMKRAVKDGLDPTYWNLKLSKETRDYVPRLIAAGKMIRNPQKYDITLPPVPDHQKIVSIDAGRRISLELVADITSATIEELRELNPGLQNERTPIYGPHRITIPVKVSARLMERLNKLKNQPLLDRQTQLEMVGRNISNPLLVTDVSDSDNPTKEDSATPDIQIYDTDKSDRFETHTVKYGDTLWSLSKKVGVDIDTLRSWNNLADDAPIKEGETLKIAYLTPDSEDAGLVNYRVNPSDSLSTIAEKFHLAIGDIRRWNTSVRNKDTIQAGQLLRIPTFPTELEEYTQ